MAVSLLKVAQYALFSDDLRLDLLVEAFLRENPVLSIVARPDTNDHRTLAVAASLIELFASRSNQEPPGWTKAIGPIQRPFFLQSDAMESPWLRELCVKEAPAPLRKRNLYATANFLLTA